MLTDDSLQRELSATFHYAADSAARLASPPDELLRQAVRYRRRRAAARTGGLAAAAAVAAVVALAASGVIPAPARAPTAAPTVKATQPPSAGQHHPGPAASSPTAGGGPTGALLAAAVAKAPPADVAANGMPSFYLVANHGQPDVQIRNATTGNLLSTVSLPAATDPKLTLAAASADDRTFAVAAFSLSGGTRFYELKVTANGHASGLTSLAVPPVPPGENVHNIALTPDGTRLAFVIQKTGMQGEMPVVKREMIEVVNLATGAVRTWSHAGDALLTDLTWDASGQRLAYFYVGDSARVDGLWRLDTAAPGAALLSGQRLLPEIVGSDQVQDALLTPDGQHILASVTYVSDASVTANSIVGGIVQLSAQTGQPLQTLLAQRATPSGPSDTTVTACQLQSADPTGDHLLVNCAGNFGRLDHARFTTLTAAGQLSPTASAW
jgi:hypothetical protein